MPRQRQGVRAPMLQAALINGLQVIEGIVIALDAVDIGEVEPGHSGLFESIHVGGVWQQPVELVRQRVSHGEWRGFTKLLDQPAVVGAGLKHEYWTGVAARVEVKYDADVVGPRMFGYKRA